MADHDITMNQDIADQQALLRDRLYLLLAPLHPALRADVERALQGETKLLHPSSANLDPGNISSLAGKWALLAFFTATYVNAGVDPAYAGLVALAVECFVCATDLLDDVADGDQTTTMLALGPARALNVSTALLTLSHQSLLTLTLQGIDEYSILRLLAALEEWTMKAVSGQHRDILSDQQSIHDLTQEECLEIAAAKAGSIVSMALRLGAICAGADDDLLQQLTELGELLGISHQLDNDAHDLYHLIQGERTSAAVSDEDTPVHAKKSDLERGKKTLPVVLAVRDDETLQRFATMTDEESRGYAQALQEAIISTWGICLLYRERARERLQKLDAKKPVPFALRMLLGFA